MVSLVWAQAANRVIGRAGTLPWRLPEDLARFRSLTIGSTVLMGRRTWESLPEAVRPLPGRDNLVLTRQPAWSAPGAVAVASMASALQNARSSLWVIGGAEVYAAAVDHADRAVVTELADCFDGDTFAPRLDDTWGITDREPGSGWSTSVTGLRYRVVTYVRRAAARGTVAS
jgi:dihydrofolate reductase